MFALYQNDNEYQQHAHAIHDLADQYHLKESLVREIYESVLKDLLQTARFRKYLQILTTRTAKKLLVKLVAKSAPTVK